MNAEEFARHLAIRGTAIAPLAREVIRSPQRLDRIVAGLESDLANERFNASKILLAVAETSPQTLSPCLGAIIRLLDGDNKILKAAAIRTLGHAAVADSRGRITRVLDRILQTIPGPDLVVAANAIEGAALIARAKPRLADRIVRALLTVEKGSYRTGECRNIAIGKALDALAGLRAPASVRDSVRRFVDRHRRNPRKTTRERAERLARSLAADSAD